MFFVFSLPGFVVVLLGLWCTHSKSQMVIRLGYFLVTVGVLLVAFAAVVYGDTVS